MWQEVFLKHWRPKKWLWLGICVISLMRSRMSQRTWQEWKVRSRVPQARWGFPRSAHSDSLRSNRLWWQEFSRERERHRVTSNTRAAVWSASKEVHQVCPLRFPQLEIFSECSGYVWGTKIAYFESYIFPIFSPSYLPFNSSFASMFNTHQASQSHYCWAHEKQNTNIKPNMYIKLFTFQSTIEHSLRE